jgi:hypothetical protein
MSTVAREAPEHRYAPPAWPRIAQDRSLICRSRQSARLAELARTMAFGNKTPIRTVNARSAALMAEPVSLPGTRNCQTPRNSAMAAVAMRHGRRRCRRACQLAGRDTAERTVAPRKR